MCSRMAMQKWWRNVAKAGTVCFCDEVEDDKRAKARAFSKEKEDAANLKSPKTRAAPAVVNTSKAAKKSKTGAPTCQVRHD